MKRPIVRTRSALPRHAVRVALAVLITVASACSADRESSVTGPEPGVDGSSANPFPRAVLTVSMDRAATDQLAEGDTLTLTAHVVDEEGVELLSPIVRWDGSGIIRTTARTAVLVLSGGRNAVNATASVRGTTLTSASTTISALPNPGEMILWNPRTGEMSKINPPAGAWKIDPVSINDRDEVTGTLTYDGHTRRAFFWSRERGFVEIPSPLYVDVGPAAINNAGMVAGTLARDWGESLNLFVWSETAGFSFIADGGAYATALNNSGHVVGAKDGTPFVWSSANGFQLLRGAGSAPFAGQAGYTSSAVAIADDGAVLTSWTGKYERSVDYNWYWDSYPAVWIEGVQKDLDCSDCVVSDMNNSHEVVGVKWNMRAPFRWTAATGIEYLPIAPGSNADAIAVNDTGIIAGASRSGNGTLQAAAWLPSGMLLMPQAPGTSTSEARDVSGSGTILVYAK